MNKISFFIILLIYSFLLTSIYSLNNSEDKSSSEEKTKKEIKHSKVKLNSLRNDTLFNKSFIPTLTDSNFDKIVRKGRKSPFLLFFTVKRCKRCDSYLEIFQNASKIIEKNIPNIKFGKVDVYSNSWTALRFNITSLPKVFYISNGTLSVMKGNYSLENILSFSNDTNKETIPLPRPLTYFGIASIILDALNDYLSQSVGKYGIKWNKILTVILFLGTMILFCYLNNKCYSICCKRNKRESKYKKGKGTHSHTHTHSHHDKEEDKNKKKKTE